MASAINHWIAVLLLAIPSLAALRHLWRMPMGMLNKIAVALLLCIPIIGPLLYFFNIQMPPELPEDEQSLKGPPGDLPLNFGHRWNRRSEELLQTAEEEMDKQFEEAGDRKGNS